MLHPNGVLRGKSIAVRMMRTQDALNFPLILLDLSIEIGPRHAFDLFVDQCHTVRLALSKSQRGTRIVREIHVVPKLPQGSRDIFAYLPVARYNEQVCISHGEPPLSSVSHLPALLLHVFTRIDDFNPVVNLTDSPDFRHGFLRVLFVIETRDFATQCQDASMASTRYLPYPPVRAVTQLVFGDARDPSGFGHLIVSAKTF
jgi:hypothetical protein